MKNSPEISLVKELKTAIVSKGEKVDEYTKRLEDFQSVLQSRLAEISDKKERRAYLASVRKNIRNFANEQAEELIEGHAESLRKTLQPRSRRRDIERIIFLAENKATEAAANRIVDGILASADGTQIELLDKQLTAAISAIGEGTGSYLEEIKSFLDTAKEMFGRINPKDKGRYLDMLLVRIEKMRSELTSSDKTTEQRDTNSSLRAALKMLSVFAQHALLDTDKLPTVSGTQSEALLGDLVEGLLPEQCEQIKNFYHLLVLSEDVDQREFIKKMQAVMSGGAKEFEEFVAWGKETLEQIEKREKPDRPEIPGYHPVKPMPADPTFLPRKKPIIIHGTSYKGHIPRPGDAERLQAIVESGKGAEKSFEKFCEKNGKPYKRGKRRDSRKP